jgi:tetratricopeptide (TPR) repeat protein
MNPHQTAVDPSLPAASRGASLREVDRGTPSDGSTAVGDDLLRAQLAELIGLLKAQQTREQLPGRFDRFYARFKQFATYVGMPSVLIAAVIPVYNLSTAFRDYQTKLFVRSQYSAYANGLLESGQLDRAGHVMSEIDAADKFDARAQYANAKLLTRIAIVQGKRQQEAIDRTNVLLLIQTNRPFYFPRLGGPDEILDLELALVDVQLQLQMFEEASSRLDSLLTRHGSAAPQVSTGRILLRRGAMRALRFDGPGASADLTNAVDVLARHNRRAEMAETYFQLAKLAQLTANDRKTALDFYSRARKLFDALGDRYGLIKVLNNVGMLYIDSDELRMARENFELEQRAAVQVGDKEGLARSLVNLAIVARNEGSPAEAVRLATEAQALFKESGNKRGLAAVHQSLANTYSRMGELPESLANARQALEMFEDVRDLRGVRGAMGVLGDLCVAVAGWAEAVYYYQGAVRLRDYLGEIDTPAGARDTSINISSLQSIAERVGKARYSQLAERARMRLRDLFGQLELKGVEDLLARRDLTRFAGHSGVATSARSATTR